MERGRRRMELPGEGRVCGCAGGCGGAERLRVACDVEPA
jgi:hypothetical protein